MPYIDLELANGITRRHFSNEVDYEELVWHRDREHRIITVQSGSGWWFQFDNEMPFRLKEKDTITIPAMVYHRLLRGETPLEILIERF